MKITGALDAGVGGTARLLHEGGDGIAFLRTQLGNLSRLVSIGRVRMRLAVAAKIAFVTAGATTAVGASPKPPGASELLTRCVSTHRRLVDPQRPIGVEIALFDPPILQRDHAVERGGQAEERSALHLGLDRVRIDDHAAIDGADDTMDLERTVGRDLDLGHLREVTAKRGLDRDAASAP